MSVAVALGVDVDCGDEDTAGGDAEAEGLGADTGKELEENLEGADISHTK